MPRTRLIVLTLVVGLLAVACGGDDSTPADSPANARPVTSTTSQTGSEGSLEPDATSEVVAQPDSRARPVRVELGSRFEWCAQTQAAWDAHIAASEVAAATAEALSAAVATRAAATDELDKAEADAALEDAQDAYHDARADADAQADAAIEPLLQSADLEADEHRDETLDIAYTRAWEAFASEASPAELALMQLPHKYWVSHNLTDIARAEAAALFSDADSSWEVWIDSEQAESLGEDGLNEAAAAAAAAAAGFSAQAVSLSDEAIAARGALRDALVAARDARDAAAVSDAAAAAVGAFGLVRDIAVAVRASHAAAVLTETATDVTRRLVGAAEAAGFAGVDSGLFDNAAASLADAEAAQAKIDEEISDSFWGYWDLDEQSPRQALGLVRAAAYDAVLLHSTANTAFARSLGESCR